MLTKAGTPCSLVCTGNMQRAEEFVAKMEEGIKMKSQFAVFETQKEVFALPNDEVRGKPRDLVHLSSGG